MEQIIQDLRYAIRQLTKSPGFTVVAILTLALGVGANTSVFTLVNSVLLRPLPYQESDSLYGLLEQNPKAGNAGFRALSYPSFLDWHEQASVFDGFAYVHGTGLRYRGPEGPEEIPVGFASSEFFSTMRTTPTLGRVLSSAPSSASSYEVVLSYRLWQRRFGGTSDILGKPLAMSNAVFAVVGVMPPGFQFPSWAEAWVPIEAFAPASGSAILTQRGFHADSRVIARLKRDIPLEQAQAEMNVIAQRVATAYPGENAGWVAAFWWPLGQQVVAGTVAPTLRIVMVAVGLVLLIACVNLANLSVTRAMGRSREMAVRAAMGASAARLRRQVFAESLILALAGGALGVGLAWISMDAIRASIPADVLPRLEEVRLDGRVLAFSLTVSLLTVFGFGLLPALRAGAVNLATAFKEGTRSVGAGHGGARVRAGLLSLQVALTVVVLVGAGLLVKSLWRLTRVDLGFSPERVVTLRIPGEGYTPDEIYPLFERMAAALREVQDVVAVGFANYAPLSSAGLPGRVRPDGRAPESGREETAMYRVVSDGFFETLGMLVIEGRGITGDDMRSPGQPVVVVNEALAGRYWPAESAIGHRLSLVRMSQGRADFGQPYSAEIVGVVRNVRLRHAAEPQAEMFLPFSVNPWRWATLVVRTRGDSARLIPELRRAVLAVDPDVPIRGSNSGFKTMDDMAMSDVALQRFTAGVFAVFALTALFLGIVGVYGVTANLAKQRVAEIGVRIALGATRTGVTWQMVRQGLLPVAIGGGLGLVAAFGLTRLLGALLFGVGATDPATFVAVALILVVAAVVASYIPARKAAGMDPMVALRSE